MIFVFGSNLAGIHGAGAARVAVDKYGAVYGNGIGRQGESYGIPTKDEFIETLDLPEIRHFIEGFIQYATQHPELEFQVTQVGCGLAGLVAEDIAPMFKDAPLNCLFDEKWKPFLPNHRMWGTF